MRAVSAVGRWEAAVVAVALLAAAVGTGRLVSRPRPQVFFSIDGGVKFLMVDQLARGEGGPDLRLRYRDRLGALWREGMFPAPTFAHQVYAEDGRFFAAYPWAFPALSVPGYAVAGHAGLRALPAASVIGVVGIFGLLALWRRVGGLGAALAIVALSWASPLPFYGAVFWEHAPAALLGLLAWFEWTLDEPVGRRWFLRPLGLGFLAGLGFWLRPEVGILVGTTALLATVVVGRRGRGRALALIAGAVAAAVLVVGIETVLYDQPLGLHARQSLDLTLAARLGQAWRHGRTMGLDAWAWMPWLAAVPVAGALGASHRPVREDRAFWIALGAVPPFVLGTALIVPNAGGHAPGPRYLLPALPLVGYVLARGVDALRPWPRAVAVAAVVALIATLGLGAARVEGHHRPRFLGVFDPDNGPCHDAITAQPARDVLVFNEAWYAAHLSGSHGDRLVLAAPEIPALRRAQALAAEEARGVVLVASGRARHAFDHALPDAARHVGRCGVADVFRLPPDARRPGLTPGG